MSFADLLLSDALQKNVAAEGYEAATPIQAAAIPHLLEGRDLLGCAQTGTGKTAAFALPIIHRLVEAGFPPRGQVRPVRVLVLSPTRELAQQIGESFRTYGRGSGVRFTTVFGGASIERQAHAIRHGVDVVIATPGRLVDLMRQGLIDLNSINTFVLDEADRMFDIGFLPDLRRITSRLPVERQTIFFSATMPGPVEQLANAVLRNPVRIDIAPEKPTTELVEQSLIHVHRDQKISMLAGLLIERNVRRAIVFTRTKHGADRVAKKLEQDGVRAAAIHGNKTQAARQRTLAAFKQGQVEVLVATDLAARGIDVDRVEYVVNFDLPHEPETYVHRIGRTGRAGVEGRAISFCDSEERGFLQQIERLLNRRLPIEGDLPKGVATLPAGFVPRERIEGNGPRGGGGRQRGFGGGGRAPRQHGGTGGGPRKFGRSGGNGGGHGGGGNGSRFAQRPASGGGEGGPAPAAQGARTYGGAGRPAGKPSFGKFAK